jgi:hypothetical protein
MQSIPPFPKFNDLKRSFTSNGNNGKNVCEWKKLVDQTNLHDQSVSLYLKVHNPICYDHGPVPEGFVKTTCQFAQVSQKLEILKELSTKVDIDKVEIDFKCSGGAQNVEDPNSWENNVWRKLNELKLPNVHVLLADFSIHRLPQEIFPILSRNREGVQIDISFTKEIKTPMFTPDGRIATLSKNSDGFTLKRISNTRVLNPLQDSGLIGEHKYQVLARDNLGRPFYVICKWNGLHLHILAGHFCECKDVRGNLRGYINDQLSNINNLDLDTLDFFRTATDEQLDLLVPQILKRTSTSGYASAKVMRQVSQNYTQSAPQSPPSIP